MNKLVKVLKTENQSSTAGFHPGGVVDLLLKDHRAMKLLMSRIRSPKRTSTQIISTFNKLKKLVKSHVAAEEYGLLRVIMDHPRFESNAHEGYEEHRVHEYILNGIQTVTDPKRKAEQMKAFCEILEHHLEEEEEELFPRVKKLLAKSSGEKLGKRFLRKRKQTRNQKEKLGASKVILKQAKFKKEKK